MNRPEPLTPEERELARLLGRPAAAAPPPGVDEAVLAAARAAVADSAAPQPVAAAAVSAVEPTRGEGVRARRPRSRLPAMLGVAATVVFAVGVTWQLKFDDQPPPPPAAAEAAADDLGAPGPAADAAIAEAAPAAADSTAPDAARADIARAVATTPEPGKPVPVPAPAPMIVAPAPANEVMALPAPPPAPAAPAAAAPQAFVLASEAAPAPEGAPEERQTLDSVVVTGSRVAPRQAARSQAEAAPALRAGRAAPASAKAAPMATFGGQADADTTTAAVDADALLPRRQWIKRIRERRDAGDLDTARASLERYLQQYPEVRVPHDLRALLEG